MKNKKAFTLIEVIVAIAMFGLVSVAFLTVTSSSYKILENLENKLENTQGLVSIFEEKNATEADQICNVDIEEEVIVKKSGENILTLNKYKLTYKDNEKKDAEIFFYNKKPN